MTAVLERANEQIFSPRSPRAVDLTGLFSLLSVVHRRFHPSHPDSFPPSSSFLQSDFAPGDLFQVIHTRFSPSLRVPRAVLSPGASTCARVQGEICYAFRCIEQLCARPAADIPFDSIISLTVSSPQSSHPGATSLPVRSTASLSHARYYYGRQAIFHFHA